MIIIDDNGFHEDPLADAFAAGAYGEMTLAQLADGVPHDVPETLGLEIDVAEPADTYAGLLAPFSIVKVPFANFGDGRGFSIATELRRAGYAGTLRAVGHILPDQYAHARRCGFDEVAIPHEQARRQPQEQWLAEVPKIGRTYQNRLMQARHAA